jgi:hypothetical protein
MNLGLGIERARRLYSGVHELRSGRLYGCGGCGCWIMVVHGQDIGLVGIQTEERVFAHLAL